jgi:hypothetical protein
MAIEICFACFNSGFKRSSESCPKKAEKLTPRGDQGEAPLYSN